MYWPDGLSLNSSSAVCVNLGKVLILFFLAFVYLLGKGGHRHLFHRLSVRNYQIYAKGLECHAVNIGYYIVLSFHGTVVFPPNDIPVKERGSGVYLVLFFQKINPRRDLSKYRRTKWKGLKFKWFLNPNLKVGWGRFAMSSVVDSSLV